MTDVDIATALFVSHVFCALAFGVLTVVLALGKPRSAPRYALVLGTAAEAVWAAAVALSPGDSLPIPLLELALPARTILLAASVVWLLWLDGARREAQWLILGLAAAGAAWAIAYIQVLASSQGGASTIFLAQVAVPIMGLIGLENLFRNADPSQRWALRFAVVGVGLIFAYDLVVYLAASVLGRPDPYLIAARGIVNAIAVPMIVVTMARRPELSTRLHVSRQAIFYSTTFVICGGVFMIAAAGGYYVRNIGGTIGTFVQIVGSAAIAAAVVLVLGSATARSRLKQFVERNFFSYKYDYRVEWARFITTIGSHEGIAGLPTRVIQATADLLDSPGGALWRLSDDGRTFSPIATWHIYMRLPNLANEGRLGALIAEARGVAALDVDFAPLGDEDAATMATFWAVIPIRHPMIGAFIALQRPRASRGLTWEDQDLLHIAGQQAASYLALDIAARALLEAQQLEEFSRRFAFVAHDLKNLISQLQLLLRNAERHKDNPDFQRDLLATLANSVAKMKKLLEQVRQQPDADAGRAGGVSQVDLGVVAAAAAQRWATAGVTFLPSEQVGPIVVAADVERLNTVLDHLIQNAVDATPEGGVTVALSVRGAAGQGLLCVEDAGPGMSEAFVREELFRPFRSSKTAGYGLGAYQARELVKAMGGALEVESAPGEGTRMTIALSLAKAAANA
ncbi:MAG: PEP-CTERM system histidine kinase PrsK [Alphaproteobacteria bacterium]|nr:PEP-CTERM system histidine kinase PrsK [Alphaproteobacteria bacterium]